MCHKTVAGCAAAISYNHITVYKKSIEKYITSCTPECRKAIDDYIKWHESLGSQLHIQQLFTTYPEA